MTTAVVTMVYDDEFFLDIWVKYYEQFTERKNLFILTHGHQDYAARIAEGCNIIELNRRELYEGMDGDRFKCVNHFCGALSHMFDRVIYNDVDELIVLDPDKGDNPITHIESIDPKIEVITAFGLEIIHRIDLEDDYDPRRQILSQRQYVRASGWYSKPCITNRYTRWRPDGHGSDCPVQYIDDDLYLFHLKWFDRNIHVDRYLDRVAMRRVDEKGKEIIIGGGSWTVSQYHYLRNTNSMLRFTIDKNNNGWDFSHRRNTLRRTYRHGGKDRYTSSFFVEGDLRIIPERFVGLF